MTYSVRTSSTEKHVKQITRAATYPLHDWRAPECVKIRKANYTCCTYPRVHKKKFLPSRMLSTSSFQFHNRGVVVIDDGKLLPSPPSAAHFGSIVANTLFKLLATLGHG